MHLSLTVPKSNDYMTKIKKTFNEMHTFLMVANIVIVIIELNYIRDNALGWVLLIFAVTFVAILFLLKSVVDYVEEREAVLNQIIQSHRLQVDPGAGE